MRKHSFTFICGKAHWLTRKSRVLPKGCPECKSTNFRFLKANLLKATV